MTVSAHDVAAVLRDRLPNLSVRKLHKLLYYCQGHHLATFDRPLFGEEVFAWDMGPVVGALWRQEKYDSAPATHRPLGEAELNTVGYVISRYGKLSGTDLEHLTHGESPWQLADSSRRPGESVRIRPDWLKEYFRTSGAPGEDGEEPLLDSVEVQQWLREVMSQFDRPARPARPDDIDEIKARLAVGV